MKIRLIILLILTITSITGFAGGYPLKKILILVEGNYSLNSKATGQGRELASLWGISILLW